MRSLLFISLYTCVVACLLVVLVVSFAYYNCVGCSCYTKLELSLLGSYYYCLTSFVSVVPCSILIGYSHYLAINRFFCGEGVLRGKDLGRRFLLFFNKI